MNVYDTLIVGSGDCSAGYAAACPGLLFVKNIRYAIQVFICRCGASAVSLILPKRKRGRSS